MAGPSTNRSIAIAAATTGRISKHIAFDKGAVDSLAASTDGKTLYVGAAGTIWAQQIAGGAPRAIRAGTSAVATADGKRLIVHALEAPKVRLFDVPLEVARARLDAAREPDKFEQEKADFFAATRAAYLQRARQFPQRFRIIDSTQSIEAIQKQLEELLLSI